MTENLPRPSSRGTLQTSTPIRHREALFKRRCRSDPRPHPQHPSGRRLLQADPERTGLRNDGETYPRPSSRGTLQTSTPIRHREALFKRRCRSDPRPHPQHPSGRRLLQADPERTGLRNDGEVTDSERSGLRNDGEVTDPERTGLRNDGETYPHPSSRGTLQTKVPKRSSASPAASFRPKIASGRPRTNRPSQ